MDEGEHEGELLGLGARVRVRVSSWVMFLGSIGLWLDLQSEFNVRVRAKLQFRVMVRCV